MLLAVRTAGLLLFNVGRATVVSVEMKVLTVVNVVRAENRPKKPSFAIFSRAALSGGCSATLC